jgi:hypothetical protein
MKTWLLFFLFFWNSAAMAKKPATQAPPLTVQVTVGELVSVFVVHDAGKANYRIQFSNSRGMTRIKMLSAENYQFLIGYLRDFDQPNDDRSLCSQNNIEISGTAFKGKKRLACLGSQSPIGRKARELLQLMDLIP